MEAPGRGHLPSSSRLTPVSPCWPGSATLLEGLSGASPTTEEQPLNVPCKSQDTSPFLGLEEGKGGGTAPREGA